MGINDGSFLSLIGVFDVPRLVSCIPYSFSPSRRSTLQSYFNGAEIFSSQIMVLSHGPRYHGAMMLKSGTSPVGRVFHIFKTKKEGMITFADGSTIMSKNQGSRMKN